MYFILWTIENEYIGTKAIATGWGTLREDGKPTCLLQEVEVPVMSLQECRNTSYNSKMISDNMLCAGYKEGKKDSCQVTWFLLILNLFLFYNLLIHFIYQQGDSGGPLIAERIDKKYELIGVVSWGNGCAREGYPGVYTRVTKFIDWLKTNARDGCFCEHN